MSLTKTQPSNNSQTSLTPGSRIVNFGAFDNTIASELDKCSQFSHREIRKSDYPALIDSLRDWLVRNTGCFEVSGYYRPAELSYWYDNETLIEVFDDLVLDWKTWLQTSLGVDFENRYMLYRYRDNFNFIISQYTGDKPLDPTSEFTDLQSDSFDYAKWLVTKRFKGEMATVMNGSLDVEAFITELFNVPEARAIFDKHISEA